jgi:hypothetical protein
MRPTGPAAPHTRAVLPASGHTRVSRCAVTPALGRRAAASTLRPSGMGTSIAAGAVR